MNINEIKEALSLLTKNGHVPFITAQPGVGKSDTVRQFAESRAEDMGIPFWEGPENYDPNGFGFIDLRLATVDSIDLGGLPLINTDKQTTQFTRSPYIPEAGHGVLFLDELPQAKAGNQAAVSQLILDKRVGSHALGENWVIIAAGNRAQDRAATHKMPTHVANRLTQLDLDFSIDVFEQYMIDNNIHEAAIAFAKYRPDLLESFKADQDINCTPRSFIAASEYIDVSDALQYSLMAGTIGEGPTAEFIGFTKIYQNLPPLMQFEQNPKKVPIPDKADIMFACIQRLAHNVTDKNIKALAKFIDRLKDAPERQVQFWKAATNKNPDIGCTDEFQDFISDNQDIIL